MNGSTVARNMVVGAASGLVAAWLMNRFQNLWSAVASPRETSGQEAGEPATVKAANKVALATVGVRIPEQDRQLAGSAVHYGFGLSVGALYGAIGTVLPQVRVGFGTAYGGAVALIADEALVPAAGLSPPPHKVPPGTHLYGLVSHFVFGAALEGTVRAIDSALAPVEGPGGLTRNRRGDAKEAA